MLYTWNLHNTVNQLYLKGKKKGIIEQCDCQGKRAWEVEEGEQGDLRGRQRPGFALKRMSSPDKAQGVGHVNRGNSTHSQDGNSWAFW